MGAGESIQRHKNKELVRENKELLYKLRKLDKNKEKQINVNIIINKSNDIPPKILYYS